MIAATKSSVPRRHFTRRVGVDAATGHVGCSVSGRQQVRLSRVLAPKAPEVSDTLIRLRSDFGLSRGQLAALLAVGESTLKSWEKGTRRPSLIARRLVWLLSRALRGEPAATLADFVTWS